MKKISVTILIGYLGLGKTSFLNHILYSNHGKKIAVIVNDMEKMNTLIMYQQDGVYENEFSKDSEIFRLSTMALLNHHLQSLFVLGTSLFFGMLMGTCLTIIQVQKNQINSAVAAAILIFFFRWLMSSRELGYFMHIIKSAAPAFKRVFKVIDQSNKTNEKPAKKALSTIEMIDFQQVSFGYENKRTLIHDFTFQFSIGKIYGFVGRNGIGKSTLAKMIQGKLKPKSGEIKLSGIPITCLSKESLQENIGLLCNESVLFSGTIEDNLRMGDPHRTDWKEKLDEYGLCAFVTGLSKGFKTQVGENGRLLSPGQRQQIAFARLLLSEKPVLILDEVTSNVDLETGQTILAALEKLKRNHLIILITHQMEYLPKIDEILFIDRGFITKGEHRQLYEKNLQYRQLVRAQVLQKGEKV